MIDRCCLLQPGLAFSIMTAAWSRSQGREPVAAFMAVAAVAQDAQLAVRLPNLEALREFLVDMEPGAIEFCTGPGDDVAVLEAIASRGAAPLH